MKAQLIIITLLLLIQSQINATVTEIPDQEKFQQNDFRQIQTHMVSMQDYVFKTMNYQLNILTPGFVRRSVTNIRVVDEKNKTAEILARSSRKWKEGISTQTDKNLDFVVEGGNKAFFKIKLKEGRVGYTRDGRFRMDFKGRLITLAGGYPVLGVDGEKKISNPTNITVSRSGVVFDLNQRIGQFDIAVLKKYSDLDNLYSINSVIFLKPDSVQLITGPEYYRVIQGMVRQSNSFQSFETWFIQTHFKASKNAYDSLIHTRKKLGGIVGN